MEEFLKKQAEKESGERRVHLLQTAFLIDWLWFDHFIQYAGILQCLCSHTTSLSFMTGV